MILQAQEDGSWIVVAKTRKPAADAMLLHCMHLATHYVTLPTVPKGPEYSKLEALCPFVVSYPLSLFLGAPLRRLRRCAKACKSSELHQPTSPTPCKQTRKYQEPGFRVSGAGLGFRARV